MTAIRVWHGGEVQWLAYTIRGPATGQDYLVYVENARWWLYPPGTFRLGHPTQWGAAQGVLYRPGSGQEITAPWPFWSRRRARRIVAKAERRVARAMRGIYRANSIAQRQGS